MKMMLGASALLVASLLPLTTLADVPGRHPAFLHALSDLRDARWNLEHREGDPAVRGNEDAAIAEVDRALEEISRAAADDGKNLGVHPREDARIDRAGRLHHALDLLRKARADASGEEDNPASHSLRYRAIEHIDGAIRATERAIHDLEHHV
jgi:hypothetical protein